MRLGHNQLLQPFIPGICMGLLSVSLLKLGSYKLHRYIVRRHTIKGHLYSYPPWIAYGSRSKFDRWLWAVGECLGLYRCLIFVMPPCYCYFSAMIASCQSNHEADYVMRWVDDVGHVFLCLACTMPGLLGLTSIRHCWRL